MLKHTFKKGIDEEEEDPLQPVRTCINQCKSLMTYIKLSGLQLHQIRTLKQECETRWNTKLAMVESVLGAFNDVQRFLMTRGEIQKMSHISKDVLQMLVQFLTPFKIASDELSASNYPTIHSAGFMEIYTV